MDTLVCPIFWFKLILGRVGFKDSVQNPKRWEGELHKKPCLECEVFHRTL